MLAGSSALYSWFHAGPFCNCFLRDTLNKGFGSIGEFGYNSLRDRFFLLQRAAATPTLDPISVHLPRETLVEIVSWLPCMRRLKVSIDASRFRSASTCHASKSSSN